MIAYTDRKLSSSYIPARLLLQWHVTERCNLRCRHCYQESYNKKDIEFNNLIAILNQYRELLAMWRRQVPVKGQITVTGGEPFMRDDFLDLLQVLANYRDEFRFSILTNGSMINESAALRLRELQPAYVQVSIEGSKHMHDSIRGMGAYRRAVSGLRHLVTAGIYTNISFTAHAGNYKEFDKVARLGRKLKANRVWADRMIPLGSGASMEKCSLQPNQTRELIRIMHKQQRKMPQRFFCRTEIAMHRALQFLIAGGTPYRCTAGDEMVTIQANGDLYPCRRMPIAVGNVLDKPLKELYYESSFFRALRNPANISRNCQGCDYMHLCRGGLRCLSYAVTGNPFTHDPGCWRAPQLI